jgi:hypothetical protein
MDVRSLSGERIGAMWAMVRRGEVRKRDNLMLLYGIIPLNGALDGIEFVTSAVASNSVDKRFITLFYCKLLIEHESNIQKPTLKNLNYLKKLQRSFNKNEASIPEFKERMSGYGCFGGGYRITL